MKPRTVSYLWQMALWVMLMAVVLAMVLTGRSRPPAQSVAIADGRTMHLLAIQYGKQFHYGRPDRLAGLRAWLPWKIGQFLTPKSSESDLSTSLPALVIWMDATKTATGQDVDCQSLRVAIKDDQGEMWSETTTSWYGFQSKYTRQAHIFECYPRNQKKLILVLTPWHGARSSQVTIDNPHLSAPVELGGGPLPQHLATNGLDLVLEKVTAATNGSGHYWETPARYWNPEWRLLRHGVPAAGWDDPEWEAEDPLGNRGTEPNINQPELRFTATWYPNATNSGAATLLATLPQISLAPTATNIWNITNLLGSNAIAALGYFPPGVYVFQDGHFVNTNPGLSAVRGGSPSGWTSMNRYANHHAVEYAGHYTPWPVIYLIYKEPSHARLFLRLRDGQGRSWPATPEEQMQVENVHPFMIKPRAGVSNATPEIVVLSPVRAVFAVKTGSP